MNIFDNDPNNLGFNKIEEIVENKILKPLIQGFICGTTHLVTFYFLKQYFEKKSWI